jgi:hypothetical protein
VIVFAATAAQALAPPPGPESQRAIMLDEVVSSQEVVYKLQPHGPIDGIEHLIDGTFRVWAKNCEVVVVVRGSMTLEGGLPASAESSPVAPAPGSSHYVYRAKIEKIGDVRCK